MEKSSFLLFVSCVMVALHSFGMDDAIAGRKTVSLDDTTSFVARDDADALKERRHWMRHATPDQINEFHEQEKKAIGKKVMGELKDKTATVESDLHSLNLTDDNDLKSPFYRRNAELQKRFEQMHETDNDFHTGDNAGRTPEEKHEMFTYEGAVRMNPVSSEEQASAEFDQMLEGKKQDLDKQADESKKSRWQKIQDRASTITEGLKSAGRLAAKHAGKAWENLKAAGRIARAFAGATWDIIRPAKTIEDGDRIHRKID